MFFPLYLSPLCFFFLHSALHVLIVPAEASNLGDPCGDHTASPVLCNPNCTASEGVLY